MILWILSYNTPVESLPQLRKRPQPTCLEGFLMPLCSPSLHLPLAADNRWSAPYHCMFQYSGILYKWNHVIYSFYFYFNSQRTVIFRFTHVVACISSSLPFNCTVVYHWVGLPSLLVYSLTEHLILCSSMIFFCKVFV